MKLRLCAKKDYAKICGIFKSASPSRALGDLDGCIFGYKCNPRFLCDRCVNKRYADFESVDEAHELPAPAPLAVSKKPNVKIIIKGRQPKEKPEKIFYLCDCRACENCSYPECRHTSKESHAKNKNTKLIRVFENIDGALFEK